MEIMDVLEKTILDNVFYRTKNATGFHTCGIFVRGCNPVCFFGVGMGANPEGAAVCFILAGIARPSIAMHFQR